MNSKPIRCPTFYSDSFKMGVVSRVVRGELTKEQARQEYDIASNINVKRF